MDKMREAFEKWYMTNTFAHIDHISVFYNDLNCYPAPIANHCWKAWQAAQSVSVPVVGNVVAWGVTKRHEDNVWFISDSRFTAQYYAQMYAHRIGENPDQVVIPLYRKPATSITADELESLRKDAERLGWLIKASSAGIRIKQHAAHYTVWDTREGLKTLAVGASAREAIDAAIAAEGEKE